MMNAITPAIVFENKLPQNTDQYDIYLVVTIININLKNHILSILIMRGTRVRPRPIKAPCATIVIPKPKTPKANIGKAPLATYKSSGFLVKSIVICGVKGTTIAMRIIAVIALNNIPV